MRQFKARDVGSAMWKVYEAESILELVKKYPTLRNINDVTGVGPWAE